MRNETFAHWRQLPGSLWAGVCDYRDADCSDFIGSFPIFAYPFRYYDNIELSSDFLGDLIIYFLVHFFSRLLVERDDFPVAVIKRRLSLASF